MAQKIVSTEVKANGDLHLPKLVKQALRLRGKGGLVGFVIEGQRVLLTKATIVPDSPLSDEELAYLARLSKRGAGKRTFRSTDAALRHLWSL